jgi:hypothetical protein
MGKTRHGGQLDTAAKDLSTLLREQDGGRPRTRIFIMGCGRSGTWLLTGIMATFNDVFLLAREGPVQQFAEIKGEQSVHVAKRHFAAFRQADVIPPEIGILAIIRHPFDVLTSHHPAFETKYHILPRRWLGEMEALRWLMETRRPKTMIVRYEDLVVDPDQVQKSIADFFGLGIRISAREYQRVFRPPDDAREAMHGLRQPDVNSVGRWRNDPADRDHIGAILPDIQPMLGWVSTQFGYNVAWP